MVCLPWDRWPAFWLEFGGNNTQSQSVRATAQRAHLAFALRKRQIKAHGSHLLQILIRVSILSPVTQPARVRQLAKRARTGWCRRSRQLVRAPPEVPQIFAEPLAWHVLHQRIERHDVLSLGMRTVIMTVGMARDHCVLDSTLVPFWLATMDGNSTRVETITVYLFSRASALCAGFCRKCHTDIPPRPLQPPRRPACAAPGANGSPRSGAVASALGLGEMSGFVWF